MKHGFFKRNGRRVAALHHAAWVVVEPMESRVLLSGAMTYFTPGDLIVMRTGDATNPDSSTNTNQCAIYLDEYTPAGVYVGNVAIPSTGSNAFTLPGAGDTEHEGVLNLSTNGEWISFAGYNVAAGTADANQYPAIGKVIGEVSQSASTLNTSTVVNSYGVQQETIGGVTGNVTSLNPFLRGAYTNDGKEFWTFGKYASSGSNFDGGVAYVSGTGPTATTTTVEGFADTRDVIAVGGQLYIGTGSSSVGVHGAYVFGSGEPTTNLGTSQSLNSLMTDYAGGQSASVLAMVDISTIDANAGSLSGNNVMYTVGDQNTPGIVKYYYDPTGNATAGTTTGGTGCWVASGPDLGVNAANNVQNPTGLIAVQDPTNPKWVDITVSGTNSVYTYIDKTGDPETPLPSSGGYALFTDLIDAPANEQFRGVTSFALPGWLSVATGASVTWNPSAETLTISSGNATIIGDPSKFGDSPTIYDASASSVLTVDTLVADGGDGDAVAHVAAISGNGTVNVIGNNSLAVGNFSQAALVNKGTIQINGTGAIGELTGNGSLTIGNGSSNNTVQLTTQTTADSFNNTQKSVSVSVGSTLDITNNVLLLNYGSSSSPLAAMQAAVKYGAAVGGASNASGSIISSTANAGNASQYAVGFADSTELTSIPTGNVEVMYTLTGDANLDGRVNFNDFSLLQNNYDTSGSDWSQGDFNHDGLVNFNDFSLLQNNYDQSFAAAIFSSTAISSGAASSSTAAAASSATEPVGHVYTPVTENLFASDTDAAELDGSQEGLLGA